jgi:MoaA/NifB/PqqE/SkfB family radical SAM enzyme
VTLSFTLGALNAHELHAMVDVVHDVGADAAHFQHTLLMTRDADAMRLSPAELDALADAIPAARARAAALAVETNLDAFAASPPAYADGPHADGPAVVPCYVGSFFTVVLGNGHVMPCCQTERPVGTLRDAGFAEIWRGTRYNTFRAAARKLPEPSPALETCECDRCYFRPHNVSVHNVLHPLSRVPVARTASLLTVDHLLRMSRLDRR